tara:strand:- start:883 stop:1197 length:315 start_codon:yes stop_codon:yes gene_type:complete
VLNGNKQNIVVEIIVCVCFSVLYFPCGVVISGLLLSAFYITTFLFEPPKKTSTFADRRQKIFLLVGNIDLAISANDLDVNFFIGFRGWCTIADSFPDHNLTNIL